MPTARLEASLTLPACSLSLWERAGVRAGYAHGQDRRPPALCRPLPEDTARHAHDQTRGPLTPTLSQRERGQEAERRHGAGRQGWGNTGFLLSQE